MIKYPTGLYNLWYNTHTWQIFFKRVFTLNHWRVLSINMSVHFSHMLHDLPVCLKTQFSFTSMIFCYATCVCYQYTYKKTPFTYMVVHFSQSCWFSFATTPDVLVQIKRKKKKKKLEPKFSLTTPMWLQSLHPFFLHQGGHTQFKMKFRVFSLSSPFFGMQILFCLHHLLNHNLNLEIIFPAMSKFPVFLLNSLNSLSGKNCNQILFSLCRGHPVHPLWLW